jgi:beta-glucosidase
MPSFPPGFVWGVATSAFQIEGATTADGRGPSIWDTFCATPGRVKGGDTGEPACDHYRRWPEDIALMKQLGVDAYRFSVAWPRIFPTGTESRPLEAGLAFYDRLVDGLLEAGITPWLTLYHWDLPQGLEDLGGWRSRGVVDAFERYADAVARRLGDRVDRWITINEPWCAAMLSHELGEHAPGMKDGPAALAAAHHLLLAHGRAVPAIRAAAPGAQVGITLNFTPATPASGSAADAEAARIFDGWFNRWFLDPVTGRGYPADMVAEYQRRGWLAEARVPADLPGDQAEIAVATDFLGVNYYTRAVCRGPEEGNLPREVPEPTDLTDIGWEIHPPSLTALLLRLRDATGGQPLYITENGAAWHTAPDPDGRVRDEGRIRYLREHVAACAAAIDAGAPLRGYFAWSLLDNFEWAWGLSQRFGLVWVDFETQARVVKDSGWWFAERVRKKELVEQG